MKSGEAAASSGKSKAGSKGTKSPGRGKGVNGRGAAKPQLSLEGIADSEVFTKSFLAEQRALLLGLRDDLVDTMAGVARDNLREHGRSGDASAFGMHQADAGSDSYDRDFALHLLSQEQDALYEINEALKRIENGHYGICEVSGKPIPEPRLRALPFARLTVECQSQLERDNRVNAYGRHGGPVFKRAVLDADSGA
ncbi:MAG TPA: TraR/DksA C4-type zinc finger protein [Verrucomicrobiales bacterium]|nr:TraR/DksA C4-type zinc finger protein [Verrucomicrobiales bacterium]